MDLIHKDLGDLFEWSGDEEHKLEDIASVVEHFTYEKLFGGSLKDRIKKEDLDELIKESLEKEGIEGGFEYAIYNTDKNEIEQDYESEGFDSNKEVINKALFPKDKAQAGKYVLALQLNDSDAYVWESIHPMIWSSVLFTMLILLAFSYSLFFIFKQKKISRIKNDFINNMTHELKTPLASISLAASSIKHPEVVNDEKQVRDFADIIETERVRMNSHIEKVLDIAALENDDLTLNFERIDLKDSIEKAISNLKLPLEQAEGEIHFESKLDQVFISADGFHLNNALTNIIENSIKYRNEKLNIQVELSDGLEFYKISIKDNGIGMTKKSVKLAFDKFYREESGNIHNRKGFGLGLSYVKSIVEAHRGTVSLKSEINKGTEVVITIPKING
jgi:two-component system phosphate regulon sensor histidine kinase PhoR